MTTQHEPAFELLADRGHGVCLEPASPRLDVTIETLAARTDATALYWDVTLDAVVSLAPTVSRYEVTWPAGVLSRTS